MLEGGCNRCGRRAPQSPLPFLEEKPGTGGPRRGSGSGVTGQFIPQASEGGRTYRGAGCLATNVHAHPPPRNCGDVFVLMVNTRDSAAPLSVASLKISLRT